MSTATTTLNVYNSFYKDIASFPELGRFRRHGAFWAKKVHDDTCELRDRLAALNHELKKLTGDGVETVLDCSKSTIRKNFSKEKRKPVFHAWNAYDRALMQHGQTLCMSAQVMNLPTQNALTAKQFADWNRPQSGPLFDGDAFVPTGESASLYRDNPDETDTCAWRTIPCEDLLTRLFLRMSPWVQRHVLRRWRSIVHPRKLAGKNGPSSVPFDQIVGAMDMLSCLLASVLLAVTIAVLAFVRPLGIRIGIIGIFGTLFALLLWLLSGKPTRGEVFGATAAFYAVAAVFVGTTSNECGCN
ncbi:hypothetical protein BKA63DRAFT_285025 [Paraphoma chrysanthemicola]|nr:hypothetical protein BKA63DRAFT_285025 [Paraphoma chrysanthemicola]